MLNVLTSFMVQNTFLALALGIIAYLWSRAGFYLPRPLRSLVPAPRKVLNFSGWLIILVISLYSVGDLIGGKTQISDSAPHYARRDLQPWLYWRQIAWQLGLAFLAGGTFLRLARPADTVVPEAERSAA